MRPTRRFPQILLPWLLILFTACTANQVTEPPLAAPTKDTPEALPSLDAPESTSTNDSLGSTPVVSFSLISPAFKDGEEMADKYTYKMGGQCSGENYSPPLEWQGSPADTKSFALVVVDPDGGNWVHWVQFNIPADVASLPETIAGPEIGGRGQNDFGSQGYGGPCPPSGTHHYVFTLYALDATLELEEGATLKDVLAAMEGHILAERQLTGLRSR